MFSVSSVSNIYRPSSPPGKIGSEAVGGCPPGFGTLTAPCGLHELVLAGVRELPFSDDVLDITREDAASGVMTEPVPLENMDLKVMTLTRRIPVWKHRAKSWRTRVPDHVTDGRIKRGDSSLRSRRLCQR